jgi:hypothetical protein
LQVQGLGIFFRGDQPLIDADAAGIIAMAVEVRVVLDADWLQDANQTISVSSKKVYDPPFSLLSAALPACHLSRQPPFPSSLF